MRNWFTGLADVLLPDSIGQRAIDETTEDYREERSQTASLLGRLAIDVQYLAALTRVLIGTGLRDLGAFETWRVTGWCLLLSLAAAPLVLFVTDSYFELRRMSFPTWVLFYFSSAILLAFGPMAATGLFERRDRPTRVLGPMIVSVVMMIAIAAVLVAAAQQRTGELLVAKGMTPEWMKQLQYAPYWSRLIRDLVDSLPFLLFAPTGLLFGAVVRRRWAHEINWRLLQVFGLASAAALFLAPFFFNELAWQLFGIVFTGPRNSFFQMLWIALIFSWTVTLALIRPRNSAMGDSAIQIAR